MGDTIDKVLGIGASFDWISPLASVLGDLTHGGGYTFLIPYDASPLSGREIGWLLGKRGIKCWGMMVVSGTLMLSVKKQDSARAYSILNQAGVPVENPPPPPRRAQKAQGRREGGVFDVFGIFDERG